MKVSGFALLGVLLAATPALAGVPDLAVTVTAPVGVRVYEAGTYTVQARNFGNADAANVVITVQMPVTHTSPQVYIMGDLISYPNCSLSGSKITCAVGTIRRQGLSPNSKSINFTIKLPESSAPIQFVAKATTTTPENITGNNEVTHTANPLNYNLTITPVRDANNSHCTGTTLTAYYECTKFPGSITSHLTRFEAGGVVSFPTLPPGTYTGTWSQPDAQSLVFEYVNVGTGQVTASFSGAAVDGTNCFEGITTFPPPSQYVSPYRVCLQ